MFINKWLLTDSFNKDECKSGCTGICIRLDKEPVNIGEVYKFLQAPPLEKTFTLLLSGNDFDKENASDLYIEKMIGFFFQPNYYLVNYSPLLFINNRTAACTEFLSRLNQKCKNQGLREILILETSIPDYTDNATDSFAYRVANGEIDYDLIIKNWLHNYLDDKNPSEIYFLVSSSKNEEIQGTFKTMMAKENKLKETREYKIANAFYEKQKLIDEYKHQLSLKMISEKDTQVYLSIQKEERANGLKWYYHEYEILPTWYKQFGHVIKVIMGKRSFKSLFNDDVKKYKD